MQSLTQPLTWEEYFMSMAVLSAHRSKDPSRQVGACIVDAQYKILGIGYNGFPVGCHDSLLPWAKHADSALDTKYPYVCHAEMNAVLNVHGVDLRARRCTIYVTLFPCNECAKILIQSGIAEVVYLSEHNCHTAAYTASRRLMDLAGVKYRPYDSTRTHIDLDFEHITKHPIAVHRSRL
jgi:dCMP deaminase